MLGAMKRKRFMAAGIWLVAWVVLWIAFVDFLPGNVHVPYSGMVAPLLVWLFAFDLLAGEEFTPMVYPELVIPGAVFWLVIALIAFLPLPGGKK